MKEVPKSLLPEKTKKKKSPKSFAEDLKEDALATQKQQCLTPVKMGPDTRLVEKIGDLS